MAEAAAAKLAAAALELGCGPVEAAPRIRSSKLALFGAYVSDVQSSFIDYLGNNIFYQDTIVVGLSDGTQLTVDLPAVGTTNSTTAVDFVGFLSSSAYIENVTFNAGSFTFDPGNTGQNTVNFPAIDDVQSQSGPLVATTRNPAASSSSEAVCLEHLGLLDAGFVVG